jgi:hypothetical protein
MSGFTEPANLAVFACTHVIKNGAPILIASHDADDGSWQFMCGEGLHSNKDAMIVSLDEIVLLDQSVEEIGDLPVGYVASRDKRGAKWHYSKEE